MGWITTAYRPTSAGGGCVRWREISTWGKLLFIDNIRHDSENVLRLLEGELFNRLNDLPIHGRGKAAVDVKALKEDYATVALSDVSIEINYTIYHFNGTEYVPISDESADASQFTPYLSVQDIDDGHVNL